MGNLMANGEHRQAVADITSIDVKLPALGL